ncbi:type IV pili methyl-accepting chemotaxis transducer N-terminal domain-containing protein [Arcobacter arenosus]|jgi:nitrate/nitrite-specific signal transduction histidine kinase|uniref:type IV pili methyl-accepting chemotaxis transducer N-terminal domain-containing protein n=1 Tax=Arcobacter arenosus TaxID=2576037 RepID=UPI003BABAAA0
MKTQSVSNKIKVIGALLMITIFTVISITIHLNYKNTKDALIVNIAGKQRMLTQRITKNIYLINQTKSKNFNEMDKAISQFIFGLATLKDGNKTLNIAEAPVHSIKSQIEKVQVLWNVFYKNSLEFKEAILKNDTQKINSLLLYFNEANNELLFEVDEIVTLYTNYIEEKTNFIKNFQYTAFAFLFIFSLYSLIQLRQIQSHANEFIEKAKEIGTKNINEMAPIKVEGEKEFVEMADNFNQFISKVSSAVNYSQNALEQSKLASEKLESLTDEFDNLISEIENKSEVMSQIDRSEDIVIESTEELLKSTKKLQDLKAELDKLLSSCSIDKKA